MTQQHEEKNAELLHNVSRLSEIEHHYNDEVEEWFGKYMKYKRHEETRINCRLQQHFPLSSVQDCWLLPCPRQDHQPLGHSEPKRTIEAEKEKKKQQVK